jgi:SAM-dependent methyltransferase
MTGAALVVQGDALHLPLPDGSVDLAISSPPYFNLRSYGAGPGEIGNERTPAEFLEALWAATRELVRVLKPTGSIFINLGDKYCHGGTTRTRSEAEVAVAWRAAGGPIGGKGNKGMNETDGHIGSDVTGVREKSLLGLPWAYALGCTGMLASLGGPDPGLNLILRAPIVLHKINGLPESVRDRVRTSDQEMLFHFVKQPRYYSALDELREPHLSPKDINRPRAGAAYLDRQNDGGGNAGNGGITNPASYLGKLPGSVWSMASEPLRLPEWLGVQHYAAFSSELPRRLVNGFSPPGICLECGVGRVPVVEREFIQRDVSTVHRSGRMNANGAGEGGHSLVGNTWASGRQSATILGYACSCTPFTDHPGSGHVYDDQETRYADHLTSDGYPNTGAGWGGKQGLGDRPKVGPWREYHLDGWKAAPTRPAVVLDCFGGTGTTALVARALGRIGISVDLSWPYSRLAKWRIFHSGDSGKAVARTWAERQGSLLGDAPSAGGS